MAEQGVAGHGRAGQNREVFFTFSNISPEPGTRVMIHVNVDCVNEVNAITDA